MCALDLSLLLRVVSKRIDPGKDERACEGDRDEWMLHRNADHAIALKSFCTRTTQQVTVQEDGREGRGVITMGGCDTWQPAFTA